MQKDHIILYSKVIWCITLATLGIIAVLTDVAYWFACIIVDLLNKKSSDNLSYFKYSNFFFA